MKFVKYVIYTLLLLFAVFVVIGLFLPASTTVERSVVVQAEPQTVYELVSDLKQIARWSPWLQDQPSLEIDYSGPVVGPGSMMIWRSQHPQISSGQQEILLAEPHSRVETALELGDSTAAKVIYQLEPLDQATEVHLRFEMAHGLNLAQRYMGLVLEETHGEAYEEGLRQLKQLAESLPAIVTEEISYSAGGADLTGYLAMPRNASNLPGVLVVHEWWGHTDYVRDRAEMLAELGYVAFALDMYGDGKIAEHPQDAQAFMMEVIENQDVAQARFEAALALIKSQPEADPQRTAAIGYCFGGAVVLSMARAGADLDGVVSFHGALADLAPVAEQVDARFLVLHGGADPMVTDEQEEVFKQEMDAAGVEWEFVEYEDAKHAFTNPAATAKGEEFDLPLEYDAEADADSWQRMQEFLVEVF